MNNNTPKHFALQLSSLISLYLSLSFLLALIFGIINLKFPDPADAYYIIESTNFTVRLGIAMVVVFFPTYLILTRLVNKLRRTEVSEQYLTLTKWLIYLSLLLGGGALLIDLVVIIMTFLNGEITSRFIWKAAAVIVVIGAAVHYYILDARGFWIKNESKSVLFGIGAALVVFVSAAYGFAYIETPATVRAMKLDQTQITDLQNIQWKLEELLAASSTLPDTLDAVYGDFPAPTAPEGRPAYTFAKTDAGFDLCATFSTDSRTEDNQYMPSIDKAALITNGNTWQYKAGEYCFKRIVNQK